MRSASSSTIVLCVQQAVLHVDWFHRILLMQDANAYLDHVLSEAGARVPTDSTPDIINDLRKGNTSSLP